MANETENTETFYTIPFGFRFSVEFLVGVDEEKPTAGTAVAGNDIKFQEVTGLTMELGIETLDEGGVNGYSHRLPSRGKFENLVLKRGLLTNSGLKSWITNAIENFQFETARVTVKLLDANSMPLETFVFHKAWPVKWAVSDFKAQENALVIETLELAYSHFKRT